MLTGYGYVALFGIVAVLFAGICIVLPIFLRFIRIVPRKPNAVKYDNFECGMPSIGKAWVQFNFRYYFYALMFVALDVIVVFLYPWALGVRETGIAGLVAIAVFILVVGVGYVHAWKRKVLEWK